MFDPINPQMPAAPQGGGMSLQQTGSLPGAVPLRSVGTLPTGNASSGQGENFDRLNEMVQLCVQAVNNLVTVVTSRSV